MLLRTIIVWALGLPATIFLFFVVILSLSIDRTGKVVHAIGRFWSRILLGLSGVRVTVTGAENLPADRPVILLSNHQGAFDIPVLQAHLPVQFRWVAKKSLFSIPIIGWTMTLAGYIAIDRGSASKAFRSIKLAAEKIKGGTSVLVFPEGTRSETGELLPFKRGAFLLASKSGVPVVPVAVTGTRGIMKKGSLLITPARVRLTIGRPLETTGVDDQELQRLTREAIEKIL